MRTTLKDSSIDLNANDTSAMLSNPTSGGPCYPFAVPEVRLRIGAPMDLNLSGAVFNGNPAPPEPATRKFAIRVGRIF
jgi:hypothetical protein